MICHHTRICQVKIIKYMAMSRICDFQPTLNLIQGHSALDAESLSKANFTGEIAGQARNDETQFHMFST